MPRSAPAPSCLPEPAPQLAKHERATAAVVVLTAVTMVVEIAAGLWTGSMALLADGWHMGSHTVALGLSWVAYWYARTRARSGKFAFGTGKTYALAGYTSAMALGGVAVWMAIESISRLFQQTLIDFDQALPVAVVGLVVNLVSALLLKAHATGDSGGHGHGHGHGDDHADERADAPRATDHNVRAAYLHVLADTLTSVLAIVALLGGKLLGLTALDPIMGVLGGALILHWAIGLARSAAGQLLDVVPSTGVAQRIRAALEAVDDVRVTDLHIWELGSGHRACIVSVRTGSPREVEYYRGVVLGISKVEHLTVEVSRSTNHALA